MSLETLVPPATCAAQIDHAVFYCLDRCAESGAPLTILSTVIMHLGETGLWSTADLRCVRDRVVKVLVENPNSMRLFTIKEGR